MYVPTEETAPCPITVTVPYSPMVSTKMKMEPITIPGMVCGRITSRKVRHQLPPRSRAASSACRSTCPSRKNSGVTMKRM